MKWCYKKFTDEEYVVDFLNKNSEYLNDVQITWKHREALFIVFYRTSLLRLY